ncbi:MAG: NPCBM/NEW2 domain-containing protein [Armatimonadota bacterium]
MKLGTALLYGGVLMAMCATNCSADQPKFDYLSDVVYGISTYPLDYTKIMGADTTCYPLWPQPIPGAPLQIKEKTYEKGIGAPYGDILIMLDGEYESFESDIGVQPGTTGIAVFQITVDGKVVFNSGEMTEKDDARHVSIPLKGAQQMKLNAASIAKPNWADAKLIRAAQVDAADPVDMAPFARVATWDPARTAGVSVFRLTEFPAEDVFTETDLAKKNGVYTVPVAKNGEGCIGLQWLERRRLREFGIQFADAKSIPSTEGVRVEGWMLKDPLVLDGHSEWQGKWTPMKGTIEQNGDKWIFRFSGKDNREISEGTLKIRWIFPAQKQPIRIKGFTAITTSKWEMAEIILTAEKPEFGKSASIEIYNGEILDPTSDKDSLVRKWDISKPLKLKVNYTTYRPWGYDRTVVRVKTPTGAFGIAVDDLLANKQIYVKDAGLYASTGDAVSLAQYKKSIEGKETVLERVRKMPDQTFENAIKALYNPSQDRSPTLLSLAFDNRKAVVDKFGAVNVGPLTLIGVFFTNPVEVKPQFGSGQNAGYSRSLDNEWMPMPHMKVQENGITYHQSVCVAPYDKADTDLWLNNKPLCLIQYTIENTTNEPAPASLKLTFMANIHDKKPASVQADGQRVLAVDGDNLLAAVDQSVDGILKQEIADNAVTFSGTIPANTSIKLHAYMPMEWEVKTSDHAQLTGADSVRKDAEAYWQKIMAPSMKIDIPDKLLKNLIIASQVHCMLASRNEENGKYVDPWIASVYYCSLDTESHAIIRGMDMMGQHDYAERSFDFFIKRENPAGYLSHGYTMIGTGQHAWFLSDHYRLTGDKEWWQRVGPKVQNICNWISNQTDKTKRHDPKGNKLPEYGLVPPGTVADWQDWGYIYAAQGYYYAGLAQASKTLDETRYEGADILRNDAEKLKNEIKRAYNWTQARMPVVPLQDGTWVPGEPYQLLKPGPCEQFFPNYNGAWLYDSELGAHHMVDEGVLDPKSKQVEWMADHMEDVQFMRDGLTAGNLPTEATKADWFNKGGFPRAQPYYGRYPELCALRDDVKPFIRTYFNQLAPMYNKEDLSIYENPWASVWNKTHETGHFLQQTHLLFLMEQDKELWLAPFVTNNWMKDGMTVAIEDAPSFFGDVSYKITSHAGQGYIEASIEAPTRVSPDKLVLRLRHPDGKPIKKVIVNGKTHRDFDASREIVKIKPSAGVITVKAEY